MGLCSRMVIQTGMGRPAQLSLACSCLFRIFPLFSASDILSHSCSLSYSCRFRIFPLRPNHLTIVPVDGPVMAALFRSFPFFSTSRFLPFGPAISKLIRFMFLSFPELSAPAQPSHIYSVSCSCHFRSFPIFSDSAVSQLTNPFRVLAISGFSGLPDFFRTPVSQLFLFTFESFPDFSDLIRIGSAVTKSFPFLFLSFPYCPTFSGCVRPPQNCS